MTKSSSRSEKIFSPRIQKETRDILGRVARTQAEIDAILGIFRPKPVQKEASQVLEYIFLKFHTVVRQLRERQRNKEPFVVNDEYDVQDLLHALLRMYFEDVTDEEYCPSYAGTRPRIDFFLRREKIAVEAKMASQTHRKKMIREELILDKEYYGKKGSCNILYCLVYDPQEIITNPRGFEDDIYEKSEKFEAKVFVVPRKT
jgi:predicted nuclease with TOPRIM domain